MGNYFCILGVYGNGNLGDDALLLAIADRVRALTPSIGIVTLCSDPELVERRYGIPGVSRSPLGDFLQKLRLVRRAKAIIIGGGTLVRDHETAGATFRALAAVFFWPLVAKTIGVPTLVYAQGLGPAKSKLVRLAIRRVLPRMAGITLRDTHSWELYGAERRLSDGEGQRLVVACDPVVASRRFDPSMVQDQLDELRLRVAQGPPYCLVALGAQSPAVGDGKEYLLRCAKTLYELHAQCGSRLLLLPCFVSVKGNDDRDALRTVATALREAGVPESDVILGGWNRIQEAVATIQQAKLVVADRLHALLFALMGGVPVVGIEIEDKIGGCLEMIGVGEPGVALLAPAEMGSPRALRVVRAAFGIGAGCKEEIQRGVREWSKRDERSGFMLERLAQSVGVVPGETSVEQRMPDCVRAAGGYNG